MLLILVKRVSLPLSFYFNVPTYCIARDVFRYVLVASKFSDSLFGYVYLVCYLVSKSMYPTNITNDKVNNLSANILQNQWGK